jgi:hypothetical protein
MFRFLVSIIFCLSFINSYAQSPLDSVVTLSNTSLKTQKIIVPSPNQSQLNTDRPSFSDNSYVLPLGGFQHENGFQINFIQNNTQPNNPTRYTGILPYSSFRLAIHKLFEIRLATALLRDPENATSQYGISDLELGFKLQVRENIAWISHFGIPNGSKGYSLGTQYLTNKISSTLPLGKTSITSNVGVTIFNDPTTKVNQRHWLTTVVTARNINQQTFVFFEGFLQYNVGGSGLNRTLSQAPGFDFGFAHKLSSTTQIDLSYGFISEQPFVNLGFSWGAFQTQNRRMRPLITPEV